jgi:hypothetical protein
MHPWLRVLLLRDRHGKDDKGYMKLAGARRKGVGGDVETVVAAGD